MRPLCGLRAELTEARVERARKSPVSSTNQKDDHPKDGRFLIPSKGNQDLNSEEVNDVPVARQSRADRSARRARKKKSCFPHQTDHLRMIGFSFSYILKKQVSFSETCLCFT